LGVAFLRSGQFGVLDILGRIVDGGLSTFSAGERLVVAMDVVMADRRF